MEPRVLASSDIQVDYSTDHEARIAWSKTGQWEDIGPYRAREEALRAALRMINRMRGSDPID